MLIFSTLLDTHDEADYTVALIYHERTKGRLRITTKQGIDAGIQIERGQIMGDGQKILSDDGKLLQVFAKAESVSVATASTPLLFARACYHVGNRHAEVQIDSEKLVYLHDHVMDDMLSQLGLTVSSQQLPFQPENGAYSVSGHSHNHGHGHGHGHEHEHEPEHEH